MYTTEYCKEVAWESRGRRGSVMANVRVSWQAWECYGKRDSVVAGVRLSWQA